MPQFRKGISKAKALAINASRHCQEVDNSQKKGDCFFIEKDVHTINLQQSSSQLRNLQTCNSSSLTHRDLKVEIDQKFLAGDPMDSGEDHSDAINDRLELKESSAAAGRDSSFKPVHSGVTCTYCQKEIAGHRYMCLQCADCNLCSTCESSGLHPHHCMLRLPCPTVYAKVAPFLEPLTYALNTTPAVSENVRHPDVYIKQEPEDDFMIEMQDHNIVPTTDSLAELKAKFGDEDVTCGETMLLNYVKAKSRDFSANEILNTILLSTSRDTSTSMLSCITNTEQPSKPKLKRKISNPGISETSAGAHVEDNRLRADHTWKVTCDRMYDAILDLPAAKMVQVYDVKVDTEDLDTGETFTEYGSH